MRIITLPGQQRVNAAEEILSGWSHWEMRLYCLSLTRAGKRTDCALCDPSHRESLFYTVTVRRFRWSQNDTSKKKKPLLLPGQTWCFQQDFCCPWRNPHWAGNTHAWERTAVRRPAGEWPGARSRVTDPLAAGRLNVISVLFLRTADPLLHLNSKKRPNQCVTDWTMKLHHQLFRCFWQTLVSLLLFEGTPLMVFRGSLTLTLKRDDSSFTLQQDARITHSSHSGME